MDWRSFFRQRPALCAGLVLAALLSTAADVASAREKRSVAILLYEGVELLDFAGPGEVFAANRGHFDVFTVSESGRPILSQGFVTVVPEHSMADSPRPDVLVVPGGSVSNLMASPRGMRWIKEVAEEAEVVMSVCNGAVVLAKTGLLDGLAATTHHGSFDDLRRYAPETTLHPGRRWVDNGKIVTAAGVSAGIDAALHLVSRLLGRAWAERTAHYMEYRWQPEAEPAAAAQ